MTTFYLIIANAKWIPIVSDKSAGTFIIRRPIFDIDLVIVVDNFNEQYQIWGEESNSPVDHLSI